MEIKEIFHVLFLLIGVGVFVVTLFVLGTCLLKWMLSLLHGNTLKEDDDETVE